MSEFDEYFFSMAFPELFLDGSGDHEVQRDIRIELDEWLTNMMWQGDHGVARHNVFCFVAFSVLQRHRAMNQGSFFVGSHIGRRSSVGEAGQRDAPLSLADLSERVQNGDDSLAQSIYFWAGNLTGSHAYAAASLNRTDRPFQKSCAELRTL